MSLRISFFRVSEIYLMNWVHAVRFRYLPKSVVLVSQSCCKTSRSHSGVVGYGVGSPAKGSMLAERSLEISGLRVD